MSDPDKGKYDQLFSREFEKAIEVADSIGSKDFGRIEVGKHDYEAWIYTEPGVRLIFYPHKTRSTGNRSIRIRDGGSKDKILAVQRARLFNHAFPYDLTFSSKSMR